MSSAACKQSFVRRLRRALSAGVVRAKELHPTASAGVGGAGVLQRYEPSHGDEGLSKTEWHRFCYSQSAPPR